MGFKLPSTQTRLGFFAIPTPLLCQSHSEKAPKQETASNQDLPCAAPVSEAHPWVAPSLLGSVCCTLLCFLSLVTCHWLPGDQGQPAACSELQPGMHELPGTSCPLGLPHVQLSASTFWLSSQRSRAAASLWAFLGLRVGNGAGVCSLFPIALQEWLCSSALRRLQLRSCLQRLATAQHCELPVLTVVYLGLGPAQRDREKTLGEGSVKDVLERDVSVILDAAVSPPQLRAGAGLAAWSPEAHEPPSLGTGVCQCCPKPSTLLGCKLCATNPNGNPP